MAWLLLVRSAALGWLPISNKPLPSLSEGVREPKRKQREVININVSGRVFQIYKWQLDKYPSSLLGCDEREFFYDDVKDEYFFDRDPDLFRCILSFYRTGRLHYPRQECVTAFLDELDFFGISGDAMEECCYEEFKEKEREAKERMVELRSPESAADETPMSMRRKLWASFENPRQNMFSMILYYVTGFFIVVSVSANIVETVPCGFVAEENAIKTCGDRYNWAFFVIDTTCVIIFTIEYILRLVAAPNTWRFLRSVMSIIDIAAIMPYYITLFLSESSNFSGAFVTLRVFRVFRIFKFSRHSAGLRILGYTLRACASELGFLVFSLAMAVIIFSTMMYYCEKGVPRTRFTSIPATFWYTIVTITTLGYGDMVPHTTIGKIVGAICSLSGVLVIALPVPVIVSNFARIYQQSQRADKRQLQFKARLRRLKRARDAAANIYVETKGRADEEQFGYLDASDGSANSGFSTKLHDDHRQHSCSAHKEDVYITQHHHLLACLESVTQRNISSSKAMRNKTSLEADGDESRGRFQTLRRSFKLKKKVSFKHQQQQQQRQLQSSITASSALEQVVSTDQESRTQNETDQESIEVVGVLPSDSAVFTPRSPNNNNFPLSNYFNRKEKRSSERRLLPAKNHRSQGASAKKWNKSDLDLEEAI